MTVIVNFYSVMIDIQKLCILSFYRTPRSRCSQVSNDVHVTSQHLTRLNVEFENFIAKHNILKSASTNTDACKTLPNVISASHDKSLEIHWLTTPGL